jgi:predicted permease
MFMPDGTAFGYILREKSGLGFNRESVLLFELNARQAGHRDPEIATFYADLQNRFARIRGVRNATLSHSSLIGAGRQLDISVAGRAAPGTRILDTGADFFTTMQIPILFGREINEHDRVGSTPVAVISELFAKTNFRGENPLGRHITLGGPHARDMEIVGVAKDAHYGDLRDKIPPVVYIPYNQGTFPPIEEMTYALRTSGDPLSYVKTVREIVHHADPRVPLTDVKTQAVEIDQNMNQEIIFARLCSGFSILALVIAGVGLYGTMSYTVARRTSEIGIRMALGAQRRSVIGMVIYQVVALAAVGLEIGVLASVGMSRLVESFLFEVKPDDPFAFVSATVILASAALVAGYLPARKASRIDPMVALRHE